MPDEVPRLIVTHQNPDIDAITSVWLLKRFLTSLWGTAEVAFVPAGQQLTDEQRASRGVAAENVIHVDTGLGEFDHHQEERGQLRVCATSLVYDLIALQQPDKKTNKALRAIVEFVVQDDHFENCYWPEAASYRYQFMLPELLDGARETGLYDDNRKLQLGFELLDAAYAALRIEIRADEIIQRGGQSFTAGKVKGLALATSNHAVEHRAQKMGYQLVVRKDEGAGHVRIKVAPRSEIDLTAVYEEILKQDTVGHWFLHASKRMLLNGSSKRQQNPTPLSLTQVVKIVQSKLE